MQPKVKINVGGMKFMTTTQTLKSQPGSFFDALLSGRWKVEDTIFIDRDGSMFKYILDFMRGDLVEINSLSSPKIQRLLKEAEFFQLPKLVTLLSSPSSSSSCSSLAIFSPTLKSAQVVINQNEVSIGNQNQHSAVLSSEEYNKGVILFKFSILSVGHWIYFGIGKEPVSNNNSYTHPHSYGWAGSQQTYSAGQCEEGKDGYVTNMSSGDVVTLLLDCDNNFLLFKNDTKKSKPFILQLPSGITWRLHLNLFNAGTRVQLIDKVVVKND